MNSIDASNSGYKISMIFGVVFVACAFILLISANRWKERQTNAIGIPVKTEHSYPLISYMAECGSSDCAPLYSFVEDFIHWKFDESLDHYEKQSEDPQKKLNYLKSKLLNAVKASKGREYESTARAYADSSNLYYRLTQCNCSYFFNIDAIEKVKSTSQAGVLYLTVLGEFQVSYNHDVTPLPDARIAGYKRIHFYISQETPTKDKAGNFLNSTGLFVLNTWVEDVSYDVQDSLFKGKMIYGWDALPPELVDETINDKIKDKIQWGIN